MYGQVVNPSDPQLMEGGGTCPICQVSYHIRLQSLLHCLPSSSFNMLSRVLWCFHSCDALPLVCTLIALMLAMSYCDALPARFLRMIDLLRSRHGCRHRIP